MQGAAGRPPLSGSRRRLGAGPVQAVHAARRRPARLAELRAEAEALEDAGAVRRDGAAEGAGPAESRGSRGGARERGGGALTSRPCAGPRSSPSRCTQGASPPRGQTTAPAAARGSGGGRGGWSHSAPQRPTALRA